MNQEIMIFYSEKSRVNSILDFLGPVEAEQEGERPAFRAGKG
jgi:hypothetical protein